MQTDWKSPLRLPIRNSPYMQTAQAAPGARYGAEASPAKQQEEPAYKALPEESRAESEAQYEAIMDNTDA